MGPQQQGSSGTCGEERNALRPAPVPEGAKTLPASQTTVPLTQAEIGHSRRRKPPRPLTHGKDRTLALTQAAKSPKATSAHPTSVRRIKLEREPAKARAT